MVMRNPSWGLTNSWKGPAWITQWFQNADVIHIHKTEKVLSVWPKCNPKATRILHQHARVDTPESAVKSDRINRTYRIVSTLNLLPWVQNNPDRWLPAPMDIEWFDNIKKKFYQHHDSIRICQTATKLAVKRTDLFIASMKKIMDKHRNVEMVLIQDTPWLECQKIKASCDILFDQVLSYGSTCLESWCFGYPAVTGMDDRTYGIIKNVIGKDNIPFVRTKATVRSLVHVLDNLISDENFRREMGAKGRRYVEKWHSYPFVANRAIQMYREAGAKK